MLSQMGTKTKTVLMAALVFIPLSAFQNCSDVGFKELALSSEEVAQMTDWMTINNGAKYTNDMDVLVQIHVYGGKQAYLTTDPTCETGGEWQTFQAERSWDLVVPNASSTVYGRFKRVTTRGVPMTTECIEASIIHDGVAPEIKFTEKPAEFTQDGNAVFKYDVTDAVSGVKEIECKLDGDAYGPCEQVVTKANLLEGQHRFTVRAKDNINNMSAPMEYPWMIDQTKPVVALTTKPDASSMSKSATLGFTGTDAGSGVAAFYCQLNNEAAKICTSPYVRADLSEGPQRFTVYAVDNVGLKSDVVTYDWFINTLPLGAFDVLGITGAKDAKLDAFLAGAASPKVNWSASKNALGYNIEILNNAKNAVVCSVANVTALSYQFPDTCALTDAANYYVRITALNVANVNVKAADYAFRVDLLAPAITIAAPVIPVDHKSARLNFTITDTVSGIDTAVCYHSFGGVVSSYTCKGLTTLNLANLSPGAHTFSIKANDVAGNLAESAPVNFTIENRVFEKHDVMVAASPTDIDVLMVIDNSGSMDAERKKLSEKLNDFISKLNGLNWRVCLTTTSPKTDGQLRAFAPDIYKIDKDTPNYNDLFLAAVKGDLGDASGDEQGIKATVRAIETNDARCFRDAAALAVVVISDEDERSWGGYEEYKDKTQYQVLGTKNMPSNVAAAVRAKYGAEKIFTFHSIVIKSMDTACQKESAGQYGRRYEELSGLTSGIVGSLCAANYGTELQKMAERTRVNLDSTVLRCAPVAGTLKVSIMASGAGQTYTVSGDKVSYNPVLNSGSKVSFEYYCSK